MSDALPLGFGLPVSGSWASPATMLRVARRAEELDYACLWSFQRVLCPVVEGPPRDTSNDPALRPADDASYRAVHDAVVPLAFVAGHTERIRLGTATICAPFTPPALLAGTMTSLDLLSGGRLTVGLGIGWMPEEYVTAGVPYERRGARMEEYLRCLHALWTEDPVEFTGDFYRVPASHQGLRPVQRPRPPLLLGGLAPAALRRAGRLADGWITSTREDLTRLPRQVALVREGAEAAGRDPDAVRVLVRAVVDLVDRAGRDRQPFRGTAEQVRDDLAGLREQGATEAFVDLNFSPRVGSPDLDPGTSSAYADEVLEALAPLSRPRPSA